MTNINILTTNFEELKTLNLEDLQNLAKELKVKNWWTMKKADLLTKVADTIFDLQDKAAVQKANEEYQKELEEMANKVYQEEKIPENPKSTPKKAPKTTKTPKVEKDEENLVTLKELAAEFHMKGTKARRLLRNETAARPFGGNRWEWDKNLHKAELELARSILKAHTK